ncbi:1-acyl-sn-glycerol-3-phosphate acyltransferase [Actimicrobium sp. GrIS 1.19]|uniref:1-acyl-sn-glycerol-3-phosphate acyltransferase n=1 Tax=Actimicrobium sp. GrIS 1.19 TaxID=3071708 RepID=UPI002DFF9E8B|nr:1-acyl-sn-glycerol-3-phosphate acyltransferase [Actimicrobium sp. GrIS 1.19]
MTDHLLTPDNVDSTRRRVAVRLLGWVGWKVRFAPLPGPRGLIIVYPHTSNWDFPIGLLAKWAIGLPLHWIGKASLFTGPVGRLFAPILRAWGGEPIERGAASGSIERLARRIQAAPWYWLALAPEGTRQYRDHWRSGFYHLALTAELPILAVSIDYATRTVFATTVLQLSGNAETDRRMVADAYRGRHGHRRECESPISW